MRYTNKLNLPKYMVDWLMNDEYDHSDDPYLLSATTLLKPVRAHWLTLRHLDELEVDVSDLLSSRYGNAIHDSIEKVVTPGVSKEVRTTRKITVNGKEYTVSGKYDLLIKNDDGTYTIRDIKTTSVWAYIYGGKDEDYQHQLSIYRWLLDTPEHPITPIAYIDFFFTDWQSMKAKIDPDYPQQKVYPGYKIELLSLAEIEAYILNRVAQFDQYRDTADQSLPACSKDELWATEDTFAVFKKDGKRATKVCQSQEEANTYLKDKKINGYIEFRPAKVKRCKYCSAAPFCSQYASLARQGLIDNF